MDAHIHLDLCSVSAVLRPPHARRKSAEYSSELLVSRDDLAHQISLMIMLSPSFIQVRILSFLSFKAIVYLNIQHRPTTIQRINTHRT
jgi:hypothetical protein